MNFEQEIHNQNNARRMNILKGFSDFSEDLLQKSEDSSELEKGHMDFSNQRVYADNSVNRKLNRVGQKYGGRNVEDEKRVDEKDNSEEEKNENKPTPPQETQPNEQGQYSTEQLTEFASQAEDWQLQEFLDNAKKSGDNSEYMQAQVNIAETELNRRRVGTNSGEENVDSNNEKNFEQQESDYQESMSNVDENGLPDFNDIEAVKNFLNENPQIKDRALAIVNDDIFIPMKDAIKLANAETKSSGEAMKTVEAAKQALDEVYNKLGGNSSMNELDMSKYSPEDIKGMSNADLQSLFEEYTGGDPEDYSRSEMEEELIGRIETENPNAENKNGPANPSLHFSEMSDDELEDMYADDNFNSMEEQVAAEKELYKRGILSGKEYDEAYGKSDESGEKVSNEQHQLLAETFGDDGEDYEDANDFLSYARDNDDDGDFANLSDEEIKNWFETQKAAINGGESNPNNATDGIEGDEHHMMRVQRERGGDSQENQPDEHDMESSGELRKFREEKRKNNSNELKGYQKFEKENPDMFHYLETKLGAASEDILEDENIENNIDDYFDNWRLSGKYSKENIVNAIKKYQGK